jgi:hypothetical protein
MEQAIHIRKERVIQKQPKGKIKGKASIQRDSSRPICSSDLNSCKKLLFAVNQF